MLKFFSYNSELKAKAILLRKNSTPAENLLWSALRRRQVRGIQFNRQKMIGNFIVDFYCKEFYLAIEVDDQSHNEKFAYDTKRTKILNNLGITVLRFSNNEVLQNLEGVVTEIKTFLDCNKPFPALRASPPMEGNK